VPPVRERLRGLFIASCSTPTSRSTSRCSVVRRSYARCRSSRRSAPGRTARSGGSASTVARRCDLPGDVDPTVVHDREQPGAQVGSGRQWRWRVQARSSVSWTRSSARIGPARAPARSAAAGAEPRSVPARTQGLATRQTLRKPSPVRSPVSCPAPTGIAVALYAHCLLRRPGDDRVIARRKRAGVDQQRRPVGGARAVAHALAGAGGSLSKVYSVIPAELVSTPSTPGGRASHRGAGGEGERECGRRSCESWTWVSLRWLAIRERRGAPDYSTHRSESGPRLRCAGRRSQLRGRSACAGTPSRPVRPRRRRRGEFLAVRFRSCTLAAAAPAAATGYAGSGPSPCAPSRRRNGSARRPAFEPTGLRRRSAPCRWEQRPFTCRLVGCSALDERRALAISTRSRERGRARHLRMGDRALHVLQVAPPWRASSREIVS